jgi:hypothetical protein
MHDAVLSCSPLPIHLTLYADCVNGICTSSPVSVLSNHADQVRSKTVITYLIGSLRGLHRHSHPSLDTCQRFPDDMDKIISNKHFRPGETATSEWMRSVRAVRDTQVADFSAPGAITTCRVTYCPPIAVSPFLLALSVSYCK